MSPDEPKLEPEGPDEHLASEAATAAADVAGSAGAPAEATGNGDDAARSAANAGDTALPAQIGAYRVRELLAHGGMGAVYIAEQESPQRTVALKVIRPGHATPELLRRFENEAQVLGLLQHPGIAQIYEAGTADTGHGVQPFFAMELVTGKDLTAYARDNGLGTRERLELVAKVCDAVSHAHQKGVIHRDLKPSNILVDAEGQPKVLDFGVARATDSDLQATVNTSAGQIVGTLPYMSPEQVSARPDDLDTRSDIYALGVICHEMLAGRLPYDVQNRPIPEIARIIREEAPASLSSVNRRYRGDIETIVSKALAKEKERRYESAASLAGDIRRHLSDEPIIARPPSTWYQLNKFARRNRALVAGTSLAFVALAIGLAVSWYGFVQASRERDRVEAINDYLVREILAAPDPSVEGVDVKVVDVIDRAADGVGEAFAGQPDLEADMQVTLSTTYRGLGLFDKAEVHARRGHELRRELYGDDDVKTVEALDRIGRARLGQDEFDDAVELLTAVAEARERLLGRDHEETLSTLADLAAAHARRGDYDRAIEIERRVLEARSRVLGRGATETLGAMVSLAATLLSVGGLDEAESLSLEARDLLDAVESESTYSIGNLNGLSWLYLQKGDYERAENYSRRAWEASIRLYGEDHVDTAVAITNVANALQRANRYEEAEPLRLRVLEICEGRLGARHQWTMVARHNLANTIGWLGRTDEAERLHLDNLARRREYLGDRSAAVAETLGGLGTLYNNTDRYQRSIDVNQEALEILREIFGEEHPDVATTLSNLGTAYRNNGDFAEAAAVAREVLEIDIGVVGPTHNWVMTDYRDLIWALISSGDAAAAEAAARERLGHAEALDENDPNRIESVSLLGHAIAEQHRYEEAEPLLLEAHPRLLEVAGSEDRRTSDAVRYLAQLYEAWGKPDKAAEYRALLAAGGP